MTVSLVPCMSKIFLSGKIGCHYRQLYRCVAGMLKTDGATSSAWGAMAARTLWKQGQLDGTVLPWAVACHKQAPAWLVQVGHLWLCPISLTATLLCLWWLCPCPRFFSCSQLFLLLLLPTPGEHAVHFSPPWLLATLFSIPSLEGTSLHGFRTVFLFQSLL